MKRFKLAASLFVSTALLSPATFAHVSFKGEVLPASTIAPHNWTGFYAGINAGMVKHTMSMTDDQAASFNATIDQVSNPQLTTGLQLGYRRQLDLTAASGVYGLEFSANFSNATFNKQYGSPFALYQLNAKNSLNNYCLLQLIGGIAADKTLLFLAAGASWSDITGRVTNVTSIPFFNSFNVGKGIIGTALGGGAEYAFNEAISARLKVDLITPNTYSTADNLGNNYQISNSTVQTTLGINYKFG
jgi:opacity protein-like surface antigen